MEKNSQNSKYARVIFLNVEIEKKPQILPLNVV